jgi:hypothetical protein
VITHESKIYVDIGQMPFNEWHCALLLLLETYGDDLESAASTLALRYRTRRKKSSNLQGGLRMDRRFTDWLLYIVCVRLGEEWSR